MGLYIGRIECVNIGRAKLSSQQAVVSSVLLGGDGKLSNRVENRQGDFPEPVLGRAANLSAYQAWVTTIALLYC